MNFDNAGENGTNCYCIYIGLPKIYTMEDRFMCGHIRTIIYQETRHFLYLLLLLHKVLINILMHTYEMYINYIT